MKTCLLQCGGLSSLSLPYVQKAKADINLPGRKLIDCSVEKLRGKCPPILTVGIPPLKGQIPFDHPMAQLTGRHAPPEHTEFLAVLVSHAEVDTYCHKLLEFRGNPPT